MGVDGEGIGKINGYTLFVKDAVIGDRVEVSIMKAKKSYAYAHLDKVIVSSPDRIVPACPKARACGGCQLQALSYTAQLRYKQDKVRNALIRIGGFKETYVNSVLKDIVGMKPGPAQEAEEDMNADICIPIRYRGKAQFPIGRDRDGRIVTGFYAGHSHNIIPIDDCVIGAAEYADITRTITEHMRYYDIAPYDEVSGTGLVRHILVRKGYKTGEIMVCLILNSKVCKDGIYLTRQDKLIEALRQIKGMTSVSVNLNSKKSNVIMGELTCTIWGEDVIHDIIEPVIDGGRSSGRLGGHECVNPTVKGAIRYSISPRSFYQVNPVQTDRLYSKALQYAALTGTENVWDLYCGIGTISLFLAGCAGHVHGVEIVPEAIDDARKNARENGIDNVTFHVGKAEDIRISSENGEDEGTILIEERPNVIVVDPPRKGCDPTLIETMLKAAPDRIVYVSCDPATFARDLKLLTDGGYCVDEITPYDLFPSSVHCEVCCVLSRLSNTMT